MFTINSAVLGAFIGSTLAFVIAIMIIIYRYYMIKKRGKDWSELTCWDGRKIYYKQQNKMSGLGPAGCWLTHKRLESWSRMAKERVGAVRKVALESSKPDENNGSGTTGSSTKLSSSPILSILSQSTSSPGSSNVSESQTDSANSSIEECNVIKEYHPVQPLTSMPYPINSDVSRGSLELGGHTTSHHSPLHSHLQHQSKSFPPRLPRTPSISSQSSLDSAPSKTSGHRGSSPQIRAYGPDGRTPVATEHPTTPFHCSRSPSPMRAISLDARCSSPASTDTSDLRTPSPSQSSLVSLACGSTTGSVGCLSPKLNPSLSPLLIPPKTSAAIADLGCGPASPLGTLKLDLYTRQEGPIYLTAPTANPTLGRLHLRVKYDSSVSDLVVHLIEAHQLRASEDGGFRDPYVRVALIPDVDKKKRQTSIHRGETHPYFDQHFKFPVSRDQLCGKELILQVLDYDRYSHNDTIGEVRIRIDELDLSKSVEIWGDLVCIKKPDEDKPELLLSLNYLPQAERLTVVIMKAKNLEAQQEPYIKVYLIINGKRVKKKKTGSAKANDPANPIWNEAFNFNLNASNLPNSALEIYLISSGDNAELGSCGIGPQENGPGKQHWQDMMHNLRKPTAMWHYLR